MDLLNQLIIQVLSGTINPCKGHLVLQEWSGVELMLRSDRYVQAMRVFPMGACYGRCWSPEESVLWASLLYNGMKWHIRGPH